MEPPADTGPDDGVVDLVIVRFGLVLIVSEVALLERVPDVAPSATVAVLAIVVVPFGAPGAATSIWNDPVADDPAASEPAFFVSRFEATGSGEIVEPFSF